MNVEKLLKDFEKKLSFGITSYSKNTIISYVDDVRLYLVKNSFERLKIEELFSENKIINYFEMLLTSDVDKYKKSSAKRKLSSISKFIDFLVDRQIISSNFMKTLDKKILLGNKIEINNLKSLNNVFLSQKFDVVINLAAQAGVSHSIKYPEKYFNSNIHGFFNICNLMKAILISFIEF